MIRLTVPSLDRDDLQAVEKVLETGFLVQGPHVAEFEQAVAECVGTRYAVAVSNCTAALQLSLLSLGVQPGDLVVTTAYSFPATANAIELCGARPVFVDIQNDTFNLDPNCLETTLKRLCKTGKRVKGIIPVHAFGQLADMAAISEIAGRHGVPVIEDAACALGATLQGRKAGAWGIMGCLSFHPRKAVTTGEGGIVTTDDGRLARKLKTLRNHGQDPDSATPDFVAVGFNYRMTDFQAALGVTQLAKLKRIVTARRERAAHYNALLAGTTLQPPTIAPQNEPVYQSYVALLPAEAAAHRAGLIQALKQHGIETNLGTWHIPLTTYYKTRYDYGRGDFPNTDDVFSRALSLPLYEGLTTQDQQRVVQAVIDFVSESCQPARGRRRGQEDHQERVEAVPLSDLELKL